MLQEHRRTQAELPRQLCPTTSAAQVKELQNYEFMDPEAQHKFQELMEMLKKAMTETFFKDMYNQIANMSPEEHGAHEGHGPRPEPDAAGPMAGGEPDFDQFMQQYGDLFGDNPPQIAR